MVVEGSRVIACTDAVACSDKFLLALGHGPMLRLKAETAIDIVHGSVSITHFPPPLPHHVRVEIYDAPDGRRHPPPAPPTAAAIQAALATVT